MTDEQKAQVAALQAELITISDQLRDLDDRDVPLAKNFEYISQLIPDNEYDIASMQKQLELYDEHHEDAPAGAGILTTLHIVSGVEAGTDSNRQKITDMLQEMKDKRESLTWQYRDLMGQVDASQQERQNLNTRGSQILDAIAALGGNI